jgi:hypothetical protein
MLRSIRLRPAALVVSAILLAFTFFLGRRPYYNWDMFPYMAVIMERPGVPFDSIHHDVYRAAANYLPPQDYQAISARQPEFAKDPLAFQAILKYFTIKPGYTALAELFYRLGIHPVLATVMPSLLGYLALSIVLFFWSQSVSHPSSGGLLTMLAALSPPMIDLARYSSPDIMCAAISVGGFALVLTSRVTAGLALLYLAVWIRPDALVLLVPITISLALNRLVPLGSAAALVIVGVASTWLILGGTGIIREYVFVDPSVSRWDSYLAGLRSVSLFLILFLAIAAGLVLLRRYILPSRSSLIWACLASLIARYLLHPVFEDRFNLPVYFLILMIGWEAAMDWRKRPSTLRKTSGQASSGQVAQGDRFLAKTVKPLSCITPR